MRHLSIIILLALALPSAAHAQLFVKDEGTTRGTARSLDCIGAGVTCTMAGSTATVEVLGAPDPAPCGGGQYVNDINGSGQLVCSAPPDTKPGASCTGTQKLTWNGTAFSCAADVDTDTNTTYTATANGGLTLTGTTFGMMTCTPGYILKSTGAGTWACAADETGSYSLPDAAAGIKGGLEIDTDLGGTAAAPQVVATHLSSALPIAQGGTNNGSLTVTAGRIAYTDGTKLNSAPGTAGQFVTWGATPGSVRGMTCVTKSAAQNITSTTAAAVSDLTWSVPAGGTQSFTCRLTHTDTTTSAIRWAVQASAAPVLLNFSAMRFDSSLTVPKFNTIQGAWASTCTNCTTALTSGVLASAKTDTLSGTIQGNASASTVAIYAADSTNAQTNVVQKGSTCCYTTL